MYLNFETKNIFSEISFEIKEINCQSAKNMNKMLETKNQRQCFVSSESFHFKCLNETQWFQIMGKFSIKSNAVTVYIINDFSMFDVLNCIPWC